MSQYFKLDAFKARTIARYGAEKCDFSEIDATDCSIKEAYESGARMAFDYTSNGEPMRADRKNAARGYVGITTGWKPCFIRLHNARSLGGSDTLTHGERALAYSNAAGYGRHMRAPLYRNGRAYA